MYTIEFSSRAQKSLRKYKHSGTFPKEKFKTALFCLKEGKPLPLSYKDHGLKSSLQEYREFHLAGDLLVLYETDVMLKIVTIAKIGTHTELFGS